MIQSMTGFGASEREVKGLGKLSVELRCSNHKFLETVFHMPDGLLALEDKLKKSIESRIKRGRITCVVTLSSAKSVNVAINKGVVRHYVLMLRKLKNEHGLKDEASINTLVHLPGVLAVQENGFSKTKVGLALKPLLKKALDNLVKTRQKEGSALYTFLLRRARFIQECIIRTQASFKKDLALKLQGLENDELRSSFLKESDISEEIERLTFHIRNFKAKILKSGPVGKELDFIAQEMQREANTLGAKACDVKISAAALQIKSQIEKIREQVQNVE